MFTGFGIAMGCGSCISMTSDTTGISGEAIFRTGIDGAGPSAADTGAVDVVSDGVRDNS